MVATAVRVRAAVALKLAGLLVLLALLVLPPAAAAVVSVLVALAVTLPRSRVSSTWVAHRTEG